MEAAITDRTRAAVVVHNGGYPADMDAIMAVAAKHDLKVIEDNSHAHGTLYKGRLTGTIGHLSGMSIMSGKSFPVGEGGILVTDDQEVYETAIAFGHYSRHGSHLTLPHLTRYAGMPLGGIKGRMNQMASALGRVQLRHYPQRMAEIQKALNHFWDLDRQSVV